MASSAGASDRSLAQPPRRPQPDGHQPDGHQPAATAPAAPDLLAILPGLLRDLAAGGVIELEVSVGEARLYLRQRLQAVSDSPGAPPAPEVRAPGAAEDGALDEGLVPVTTPLSGVFYAAPSPNEPPYVREGDPVEPGQVVGLIEAMKVFNEIRVEAAGEIVRALARTGDLVQAGQVLFLLRPAGAEPPGDGLPG